MEGDTPVICPRHQRRLLEDRHGDLYCPMCQRHRQQLRSIIFRLWMRDLRRWRKYGKLLGMVRRFMRFVRESIF
jgi:hypothetical protein